MKSYQFEYTRVASVTEAVALLRQEEDPRIIAGGQSLIPILNMRLANPSRLIDIGGISSLRGIERIKDVLRIGALTRHADVLSSEEVTRSVPLLARAIQDVAHPGVRNKGTFGGSVCLADPAAEIPAICVALGASFEVQGIDGLRRISADDFFLDIYETALAPAEVLIAAELPVAKPGELFVFKELSRRQGDFAIVGIAVKARFLKEKCEDLAICYFGVSARPVLAKTATQSLIGNIWSGGMMDEAVAALTEDLQPQDDHQADAAMRLHLAGVLLKRCLTELAMEAKGL